MHAKSSAEASHTSDQSGPTSPFSQPEMSKRDSHAFVFGSDALTIMSRTRFEEGETVLTDPFAQLDEGESAVRSETASRPRPKEQAKHGSGPSSKESAVTVRRNVAVATPKRNSPDGSRADRHGTRRDSARVMPGERQAGVLC
ncbi:hypothetical protein PMIN03_003851 [Paraphaeosphaeria minitans]